MNDKKISDSLISGDDDAGWLVTYADLVTLLLVFFVLLYSLSSIDKSKYISTLKSIKNQMQSSEYLSKYADMFDFPEYGQQQITLEERTGLISRQDSVVRDVNRFISQNNDSNEISYFVRMGKIVIRLDGNYVFPPDSAEINKGFIPLLDKILAIMYDYPDYTLNIKGHTDDTPVSNPLYPSNWELSSARATAVLKYLIKNGVAPERLTATGYGSTMPIVANNSEENRARNRRVEFELEKETYQY